MTLTGSDIGDIALENRIHLKGKPELNRCIVCDELFLIGKRVDGMDFCLSCNPISFFRKEGVVDDPEVFVKENLKEI